MTSFRVFCLINSLFFYQLSPNDYYSPFSSLLSGCLTTQGPANNIHGQGSSSRWRNEGLYFRSCPGDTSTFLIVAMKYDALYTFSNISISFTFHIGVRTLYFHNVNDFISEDHHVFVAGYHVIIKPAKLYPYFSRWFRLITVNLKWMSLNMLNMNIILTRLRNIFVNSWCFLWYTGECLSRIHWVVHRNLKTLLPSARPRRLDHDRQVSDWGLGQNKMDLH